MENRLDALKIALGNEIREHKFYLEQARRTASPVGKLMFEQIAGEEMEHYQRLQELHHVWVKEQEWPPTVPLSVGKTKVSKILQDAVKEAKSAIPPNADDLEAVRTAIVFEAKGVELYGKLRDNVTDPKEKAFFALLADIEREHYTSLKDTEQYIIDPASWFREKDRGGLDGA
jgi:rubrerythrin